MALVRCTSGFSYPTAGGPRTVAAGELLEDSDPAVVARRELFYPSASDQATGVSELAAEVSARLAPVPGAVQTAATAAVAGRVNRYDATSGALAPTAPAVGTAGAVYEVTKTDASANAVTVGGETLSGQGDTVRFVSDGSSWVSGGVRTTRAYQSGAFASKTTPEQYGAKGDGVLLEDIGTTSGSTTVTSPSGGFAAAAAGMILYVDGGGSSANLVTTIASVTSATQVVGATAAGSTVSGRTGAFGSDDTAAFQAAIDAAPTTGLDLTLDSRKVYMIGGPQVSGTVQGTGAVAAYSWTYTGQLLFPARGVLDGKRTFRIGGTVPAARMQWGASDEPSHKSGAILFSTATSGNVFDVIPHPAGMLYDINAPYSNIYVALDKLTVRTVNNPQCNALYFRAAGAVDISRCSVDVAAIPSRIFAPTGNAAGIYMPQVGNSAVCSIEHAQSVGFPRGIVGGEHTTINETMVQYCNKGLEVGTLGHAVLLNRLLIQDAVYGITATGPCCIIGSFDIQESRYGAWYDTVYAIDDSNNYISGALTFVNGNNATIPMRGGNNLNLMNGKAGTGWYMSSPLRETFARQSATGRRSTTLGTAYPSGHPWRPVTGFGAFGVNASDKAYAPSASPASSMMYAPLPTSTYRLRANLTTSSTYTCAGISAHHYSNDTYFFATLNILTGGVNAIKLEKFDAGVKTTIINSTSAGLTASTAYDVELRCTPEDISLWVGDVQIGTTYTFSAAERAKFGRVNTGGLYTYRAAAGAGDDGGTVWNSINTTS